jgi:subtilase family serine protease
VQLTRSSTPPTASRCRALGRGCFTPQSTRAAYNLQPLYDAGWDGRGITIAIVVDHGSETIRHDLHVYNQAFGLTPMCGEDGVSCGGSDMPIFTTLDWAGSPMDPDLPSPKREKGPRQSGWALETTLDVETAHAMAPGANILLVATHPSDSQRASDIADTMDAEQYVVDTDQAQVISQSFALTEDVFPSPTSLKDLRHAFVSAAAKGITVLGGSGDSGTANERNPSMENKKAGPVFKKPTVNWPASDPLVTGVGGTDLCTYPTVTRGRLVDRGAFPDGCRHSPGAAEVGWTSSGGGFSHVFDKPAYQSALPLRSTRVGVDRGVPDVSLQAGPRAGALVFQSLPPGGLPGLRCNDGGDATFPCGTGWYDAAGTSLSCPQWAGLVAIAAQINGKGLGPINPGLYKIGADPARYRAGFNDITTGNNTADLKVLGYPATTGWDPVTGLGTPNAARLLPDLVRAVNGS